MLLMKNQKNKNLVTIDKKSNTKKVIPDLISLLATESNANIYNEEITYNKITIEPNQNQGLYNILQSEKKFNTTISYSSINSNNCNIEPSNNTNHVHNIKIIDNSNYNKDDITYNNKHKNVSQLDLNTIPISPPNDTIEKILLDGLQCKACELYKTRTNFVLGEGPIPCDVVFIGEAPGAEEDATGRPFVGRAGQHLDKILASVGFKREEVYICNILKDRPPNNRTPTLQEMRACSPLLIRQLKLVKPKIIALLGNTAIKFVIGEDAPGITKIHGKWFRSIFGIPCMPMYHPSFLLRNPSREVGSPNWQMWQDIKAFRKKYEEILNGVEFKI